MKRRFTILLISLPMAVVQAQDIATLSATCMACHGQKGEGNPAMKTPRLAGQPALYLARQLHDYAEGRRPQPVMSPIAQGLSAAQMQQLAAYYAAQFAAPAPGTPAAAPANLARGQQLANVGDQALQVQACANCHGPGGSGLPPALPYLAGQSAAYLGASLVAWKNGARKTDPSRQMNQIAARLGDADIDAVAAYFASQPPPSPPSSPSHP